MAGMSVGPNEKRSSENRAPLRRSFGAVCGSVGRGDAFHCGGWSITCGFSTGVTANRGRTADNSRNTAGHCHADLAWNAFGGGDEPGFADLSADGVRHFPSADLLLHAADSIGHLAGAGFLNHAAGGVGNSASDALFSPCAGGVGNFAGAGFLNHVADGVGDLFRAGLGGEGAGGVGNFGHALDGDLSADGVGHLLMADFGDHAGAGDGFLDDFGNPAAAADGCRGALHANLFAVAGVAGITDAFFNHSPGNLSGLGDPFAAAFVDGAAFGDWFEGGVADVLPAGLGFSFPAGGADIAIAGLVDGLADCVADRAVAGLVDGFADCVADVAVAGLVDRLADSAGDIAIAGLVDGFADREALGAVAGLIDRLANGVALVAVAGFVDVFDTADGTRLCAVVVDGFHAVVLFGFPNNILLHAAVCGSTAASGNEIAARRTGGCRTAEESAGAEHSGH
ncbi:MAG: hypothetical protein RLZZ436_2026 [Planctomycetota bacterium]